MLTCILLLPCEGWPQFALRGVVRKTCHWPQADREGMTFRASALSDLLFSADCALAFQLEYCWSSCVYYYSVYYYSVRAGRVVL